MDERSKNARLITWAGLVREANTCGMRKTEWCRQHGISPHKFQYWQKRVREFLLDDPESVLPATRDPIPGGIVAAENAPSFFEVPAPNGDVCGQHVPSNDRTGLTASMALQVGPYQILISDDVSEEGLAKVLRAIRHA